MQNMFSRHESIVEEKLNNGVLEENEDERMDSADLNQSTIYSLSDLNNPYARYYRNYPRKRVSINGLFN